MSTYAQDIDSIHFKFISGDNILHGKVTLPKGEKRPPLIVFLPGSGESSYRTNYKRWLANTIEQTFINDFAILNFDKPGIGLSTGAWYKEDFFMQARNAIEAVRYAKKHFPFDTSNVFVIGHSQGGWHTQIVASKYGEEIKGAISLAGPATNVFEQDVQSATSEFLCKGFDSSTAVQKAVLKTYEEHVNPVSDTSFNKDRLHSRRIQGYEPWDIIETIKTPFVFFFGQNDELVYADRSIEKIKNIFSGKVPANISVRIISGADHSFRIAEKCYTGSTKNLAFSGQLNSELREWILKLLKPQ